MKRIIAITLVVMLLLSVFVCSFVTSNAADTVTLSYAFSGEETQLAGFAEGSITITVNDSSKAGNYYLYWADDTKALEGYRQIGTVTATAGTAVKYRLLDHVAIPPKATKIIAIKSDSVPTDKTVASATAVTNIHSKKVSQSGELLYSFGAFSDPQLANDSYGEGRYPYDETHLIKALETFEKRGVSFLVSSGDTVNDQNGNKTYATEYKRYQKILADSDFANPVWESNGNHDVHVTWQHNVKNVYNKPFVMGTGVDSTAETIKSNKMYFEMTEPTTGDHFIFMAQEGGFYTNEVEQFSDAQLDWLEGLLKKYDGDGKNIFIMEHANVEGWGSGDKASSPYYYDLGMKKSQTSTARFIKMMETYKNCVIVTGHTHLELSAHLNYNDNNGTSSPMIHNSAVGGVRRLINGSVNRDPVLGMSEGYIVDVYENCVIFNGINLYYNEIMPDCTYILPFTTSANEQPIETQKPTEDVKPTEAEILYGDVDLDGRIAVTDATAVQRHVAKAVILSDEQLRNALVSGDVDISIMDATIIQQYIAKLITKFPVETANAKDVAKTGADDIATLISTVKAELSSNYIYSSFDQYMKVKRIVKDIESSGDKSQQAYDKLNSAFEEYKKILADIGVTSGGDNTSGTIDVYFTNNLNWSTVNAYVWEGSTPKAAWPGESMEYVETNSMGQKIYKITLETNKYSNIIFNNGSTQTVDLPLSNINNEGFYTTTQSSGKYNCDTYIYGE